MIPCTGGCRKKGRVPSISSWLTRRTAAVAPSALIAWLALAATARGDDAAQLFEKSVRPLFERKCFECHSSKADELKGNLKLETMEQVLKGGATGPAIIAGDVENSFLLRAIRYQEDDYQMPPSGRLPVEDIALVEKWVRALKTEQQRSKPGRSEH